MSVSAGWTASSTSISVTRRGERSRSTPLGGGSSTIRRCVSAAPRACSLPSSGARRIDRRICGPFSTFSPTPTSSWCRWTLACLRDRGPYPVLVLSPASRDRPSSTFSAILRALIDPNTAPLRALPREDRDLFIAASNGSSAGLRQRVGPAGVDLRHAVPVGDWRRFRGAPALHRPRRGAVRRHAAGHPERDRGHRDPAGPGRSRGVPDAGSRSPRSAAGRKLNSGRRSRPSARASSARCSTRWSKGLKRLPETQLPEAAAHGRLRAVGDRMRDGALARRAPSGRPIAVIATRLSRA